MSRSPENPVLGVLAIIRRDGRLLMIQRSATVRAPLSWCFPGGAIEPGESQADALVREMREEIDLEVEPTQYLTSQTKHGGRLVLHCWSAEIVAGRPRPNPSEVAAVAWMTPEEIRAHPEVLNGTAEILGAIGL